MFFGPLYFSLDILYYFASVLNIFLFYSLLVVAFFIFLVLLVFLDSLDVLASICVFFLVFIFFIPFSFLIRPICPLIFRAALICH